MNREYTYIDGKVIISDENNEKIQSEYYDNLDKVLIILSYLSLKIIIFINIFIVLYYINFVFINYIFII